MCWCAFSGLTFRVYLFGLWNSCHDNDNCLRYWQRGSGTLESFPESSRWRRNEGLTHFHGLEERKARGEIYDRWNCWWCRLRAKATEQIKGEWLVIKKTQERRAKHKLWISFLLLPYTECIWRHRQRVLKAGKKIFVFVFFFFLFTDYLISIFENSSLKSDIYTALYIKPSKG